jgi:hypothetical protein
METTPVHAYAGPSPRTHVVVRVLARSPPGVRG